MEHCHGEGKKTCSFFYARIKYDGIARRRESAH
jgi:hypothetical protein